MKKTLLASTLAVAFCAPAAASSYYVVVPLPAKAAASAIAVALSPQALPAGLAGTRYSDFDFRNALTITGDPDFNPEYVRWTVVSGALPAGMAISSKGTLTGTPGADGSATFELRAYYKSKEGVQRYVLTIKERGSVATVLGTGMLDWGAIDRTQLPQVRSIAVSNTGDRPMSLTGTQFSGPFELVGSTCMSVAPGGTCSLAYRLNDTVPGDYGPATVGLSGAAGGVPTVKLSGRVLGPLVTAEAGAADFGSITLTDTAGHKALTWRNKGNMPMTLVPGAVAAPFALVSHTCQNVAPGATCQATFSLATAAVGEYSSTVAFTGGGAVAAGSLTGKVVAYELTASLNPMAFGAVPIGTSSAKKVTVRNAGAVRAPLTIPALAAPFKHVTTCGTVLEAGASCDFTVTYSPTDLTSKSAAIFLPGLTIGVTGTGDRVAIETAGAGRRWQDGTYAASCKGYLAASGNYRYAGATGSGVYTVDPDGAGSQPTVDVYCDMTTDGGGWTLVSNVGLNAGQGTPLMVAAGNYSTARNPASLTGSSGGVGLNRWASNTSAFSMARIDVVAGDDANQVARFYKTVTYANMASWAMAGAVEPNVTSTCTNLAMTQNCTAKPFDHNYNGSPSDMAMLHGVNLLAHGYPASPDMPVHGQFDSGSGGFCSVTGNNNDNQWHDSLGGHWGNGMRIWLR